MIKAHKIRLNPTEEQAVYFRKAAGTRRFVFNWGLAEWKRQHEAGEKPSAMSLKKQFNAIKKDLFPWVYDVTKSAVEGAFVDLGDAFSRFFVTAQVSDYFLLYWCCLFWVWHAKPLQQCSMCA